MIEQAGMRAPGTYSTERILQRFKTVVHLTGCVFFYIFDHKIFLRCSETLSLTCHIHGQPCSWGSASGKTHEQASQSF
jgi:hypothetical protein